MITKDINGNNLSADYATTVQSDTRTWQAKLLRNGTELTCGIKRFEIIKGSTGNTGSFTAGAVIASQLNAEVLELTDIVKGQEIEVQIGLDVNGSYEWISCGLFTVSDANKNIYSTSITAFGACTAKTGGDFTSPQDMTPPQALTIANIVAEIETEAGVTVNVDAGIDQSAEFVLPMTGITTYQALQAVTEAVGGYTIDTYDGEIDIKLYDATPTISVNAGLMKRLPQVEEVNYSITGVAVNTAGGLIKSTTAINYVGDAQWLTLDMFNDYESALVGYTYRPASIDLSLGDPRLEGNDVLAVTDANGDIYTVPCHSIVHIYDGGFMSQIISSQAPNVDNDIATPAPLTERVYELQERVNTIEKEKKEYFWHTSTDTGAGAGSHITQIPQQEFLARVAVDPTDGGGNALINSSGMKIRDGLTDVAYFGDHATIGISDGTESYADIDYHSFQMIDKEGDTYAHISDLRDRAGIAQLQDSFVGDGTTRSFMLHMPAVDTNYTVTVDDIEVVSGIAKFTNYVFFNTTPADGANILVTYASSDIKLKAYTLGIRMDDTKVGAMSFAEGYQTEASGDYSHAEGYQTEASGDYSHAEGFETTASGPRSHAGGYKAIAGHSESFAHGSGVNTSRSVQAVFGQYNNPSNQTLFEVGNGSSDASRKNAFAVTTNNKISINETVMEDFVTDYGTSGNWTYRKWKSGILELWYVGNPGSYTIGTQSGNLYAGGTITYNYPISFIETPRVFVNATLSTQAYVVWAQATGLSLSSIDVRIVAGSSISSSNGYNVHIYAVGKWE